MAKQLTIDFTREHACSECGEMFPAEALNHYDTCETCVDDLEALADFRTAVSAKRRSRVANNYRDNNYESRQMGLHQKQVSAQNA